MKTVIIHWIGGVKKDFTIDDEVWDKLAPVLRSGGFDMATWASGTNILINWKHVCYVEVV